MDDTHPNRWPLRLGESGEIGLAIFSKQAAEVRNEAKFPRSLSSRSSIARLQVRCGNGRGVPFASYAGGMLFRTVIATAIVLLTVRIERVSASIADGGQDGRKLAVVFEQQVARRLIVPPAEQAHYA